MEKQITVVAAADQDSLEFNGADVAENSETVGAAKQRARYLLTEEYRLITESSARLGYAQVLVNGKCVADFFGKGGN